MSSITHILQKKTLTLSYLLLSSIFLLDILVPLGVAIGVLYVLAVTLILNKSKKEILSIAFLASLCTVLVPIFTTTPETTWMAYTNRMISLVAIWATAFVVIKFDVFKNIKQQKRLLEKKNEQLEHFAYIASHDLHEPLRTVTSFTEIIQEEYEDKLDGEAQQYFSFINKATKRMRGMVEGLLDYSRIGKSDTFKMVNLNEVVEEIKSDIAISIKEKKGKIEYTSLPELMCLRVEIRQLFQNLILNALKFSKKEVPPKVSIDAIEKTEEWIFSVKDNGIGIAQEQQHKIFGIFSKLHMPSEYGGQGIGLAFCKKIVELHNGDIWVESIPNEGSQFYFSIKK